MKGLNKLYYLRLEIKDLQEEIRSIPDVGGMNYSGMPHSTGISDPTFSLLLKKEKLIERLNKKIEIYLEELARIEDIIDRIEDVEVRAIARMRYIQNMKWEEIGRKLNYDRTSCAKKLKNYFEEKEV